MMGERTVMQEALFYEFSIDRHVPILRDGPAVVPEVRSVDRGEYPQFAAATERPS